MKSDEQNNEPPLAENNGDDQSRQVRHSRKKLTILLIALLVPVCLAGGLIAIPYITQMMWQNSAEGVLMSSLKNTLELQQMKFHTDFSSLQSTDAGNLSESLAVDGAYKKGAGLEASATSKINPNGIELSRKSQWVLDSSSNTYGSLRLVTTKAEAGSPYADIPKINNSLEDTSWTKYGSENLNLTYALYGLQACALTTLYETQSKPKAFQDLMKQFASSAKMQKTASASGTDTYTITVPSDERSTISKRYAESNLYKSLVDCDQYSYASTKDLIDDMLKGMTMTIKVDTTKKLISSLSITGKNALKINATFTPANDVNIVPPKNPTKYKVDDTLKLTL